MDRVEEIIEHERAADGDEAAIEQHRWEAARLIWEELQTGTSKTELAEMIGKSRTHVLFAARCWELVKDMGYLSNAYPSFSGLYHSDEVRGDRNPPVIEQPGDESRQSRSGKEERREADPRDEPASWVAQIVEGLELLETYRVGWGFLTADNIENLSRVPARVNALVAEMRSNAVS